VQNETSKDIYFQTDLFNHYRSFNGRTHGSYSCLVVMHFGV